MLLERNLLPTEDAFPIERAYLALGDSAVAYSSFDGAAGIRGLALSPPVIANCQSQFVLAARWHRWRNRPELAESYTRRAAVCKAFLQNADERGIKAA